MAINSFSLILSHFLSCVQLMSDSGELTILSKRRSGFLPSRGKKDSSDQDAPLMDQFDDAARVAFLTEAAKRASGFLPMRGRKSDGDFADSVLNNEMMQKRRVSSFMPMRGRKWSGPAESANMWYHRYYHPVPLGAAMPVAEPAPMANVPVRMAENRLVVLGSVMP